MISDPGGTPTVREGVVRASDERQLIVPKQARIVKKIVTNKTS